MLPLGLIGWFIRQPVMMKVNAFLMILAGLAVFGGFEWFREAARKPFVISGYMYSNGVLVSDTTAIKTAGYTGSMKWKHSDPSRLGEDLFRNACQSCHSIDGYNGLADKLKVGGYTEERLVQLIPRTGYMRGAMPPFLGTAEEAALIAGYVASKAGSITVSTAQTNPEHLWKINCGLCHTIDGFRPLRTAFTGMSHSDIKDAVLTASELSDAMPPFYGSDADADKIATYIETQMTAAAKGGNQ
jgi:mono/diheme cytochrome c family protein